MPDDPYFLPVKVTPNASRNEVAGWLDDGALRIRVQSPPRDGKANKALIAFLSDLTSVSKNRISIVSGKSSRQKVIAFERLSDSEFETIPRK